jgi:hypothetical protein
VLGLMGFITTMQMRSVWVPIGLLSVRHLLNSEQ